ncbi:MAG: DUF5683 domain-containing protein, partial [Balneolaceae bacterium]
MQAQDRFLEKDFTLLEVRQFNSNLNVVKNQTNQNPENREEFPDPGSVLLKSVMIPGWGQIVNKQAWKVPIVYGLLTGSVLYTRYLTKQYHDYRAAFFNVTRGEDSDFR